MRFFLQGGLTLSGNLGVKGRFGWAYVHATEEGPAGRRAATERPERSEGVSDPD